MFKLDKERVLVEESEEESRTPKRLRELRTLEFPEVLGTVHKLFTRTEVSLKVADAGVADASVEEFQNAQGPASIKYDVTAVGISHALRKSTRGYRVSNEDEISQGPKHVEMEDQRGGGLFGSHAHFDFGLSRCLQPIASSREKRIIAIVASLLVMVGLIVSLVFVTLDFLTARTELARTVHYIDETAVALPSLWFCTPDTRLPTFSDYPKDQYKGQPLLWFDWIRGTDALLNLSYPRTSLISQLYFDTHDLMGGECENVDRMDAAIFQNEMASQPYCFACVQIERTPALFVNQTGSRGFDSVAAVRISRHAVFGSCKEGTLGLSKSMQIFFSAQMIEHGTELERRGILNYGGLNISDAYDAKTMFDFKPYDLSAFGFPQYYSTLADMYCNTYLFSGYFYPSSAGEIKFGYDKVSKLWERVGTGRYFPENRSQFSGLEQNVRREKNFVIGSEVFDARSIYAGRSLQVMTNYSRIGTGRTFTTLLPFRIASIKLQHSVIHGQESFQGEVLKADLGRIDVRSESDVYMVDLSMQTFLSKTVMEQSSVSWAAFLADFFGLTSLFLDVSVYTVIISPLLVRARNKHQKRRQEKAKEHANAA